MVVDNSECGVVLTAIAEVFGMMAAENAVKS